MDFTNRKNQHLTNTNEDITIFLKNGNFMNVDSISGCKYCGKWHYKCVKGKAVFYIPFHSLDYTHHETFDDEE